MAGLLLFGSGIPVSLKMEAMMGERQTAESLVERGLFASRWLMAPMYLGLTVALLMLLVIFFRELVYYVPQMMSLSPEKTILVVLTLIDLTLAANLLLIVMFSGYESFVSKFDFDVGTDRPGWMGKVDFGGLKMKLIASIVAISAIHLLKRFMEIGDPTTPPPDEGHLFWLTVIHMSFVLSGVLMALMDWLQARSAK
ncbi:TIGR00645 family protein [Fuscovulum ytuae]